MHVPYCVNRVNSSLCVTGFVKNPGHGTKLSPDVNVNEDTGIICVRKSVPNSFQTGQNTTDVDLCAIQNTADDTTGKQPNFGFSKLVLINNTKSFQCFQFPQREVLSFLFVLNRFTILKRMIILHTFDKIFIVPRNKLFLDN